MVGLERPGPIAETFEKVPRPRKLVTPKARKAWRRSAVRRRTVLGIRRRRVLLSARPRLERSPCRRRRTMSAPYRRAWRGSSAGQSAGQESGVAVERRRAATAAGGSPGCSERMRAGTHPAAPVAGGWLPGSQRNQLREHIPSKVIRVSCPGRCGCPPAPNPDDHASRPCRPALLLRFEPHTGWNFWC